MVELLILGNAEMPDGSPRNGAKTNSHAPSLPYHAPQMIQDIAMMWHDMAMIWGMIYKFHTTRGLFILFFPFEKVDLRSDLATPTARPFHPTAFGASMRRGWI